MLDDMTRNNTIDLEVVSKEKLFEDRTPIARSILEIGEIIIDKDSESATEGISLKELFRKENMDRYHIDCLILCKIAKNMLSVQKKLRDRNIFPGLFDLEDVHVNLKMEGYPISITHPEKFQLLDKEQDYEWYPEDERIFGDLQLFDQEAQLKADQRFLYKILTASRRGNVKVPPAANTQDYSHLFYGTLPAGWREVFEKEMVLSHGAWERNFEEMILSEEHFEKMVQEKTERESRKKDKSVNPPDNNRKVKAMFVLLRTECNNSLEISRMLYQAEEDLETEQEHGRFQVEKAFLYGDGVIKRRDFKEYDMGFRVQIPQEVAEYSIVEGLLIAFDWMTELIQSEKEAGMSYTFAKRIYLFSDGKIENNTMFKECLNRTRLLKREGCQIMLFTGRQAQCEGWTSLQTILEQE